MSKGGVNEFNWGVVNPDKVAVCIYADNTAFTYDEDFAKVPELANGMTYLYCTFAALRISCCSGTLVSSRTRTIS